MPPKKNKQLEKLLDQRQAVEAEGRVFNEQILNDIRKALVKWENHGNEVKESELWDYHPLIELAKLGVSPVEDASLRAKCHMEIASYMYPKVKSFEIKSQEDKTVNVNINIAGYARKKDIEIEAEELSGEIESGNLESMVKRMIQ